MSIPTLTGLWRHKTGPRPRIFHTEAPALVTEHTEPAPTFAGDLPPYSTPRAACTLQRGEHVQVDGVWREIDHPDRMAGDPPQVLLFLTDGGILGSRFDFPYVSRDRDEIEEARRG